MNNRSTKETIAAWSLVVNSKDLGQIVTARDIAEVTKLQPVSVRQLLTKWVGPARMVKRPRGGVVGVWDLPKIQTILTKAINDGTFCQRRKSATGQKP